MESLFIFMLSLVLPYLLNASQYDIAGPRQALSFVTLMYVLLVSYLDRSEAKVNYFFAMNYLFLLYEIFEESFVFIGQLPLISLGGMLFL